MDRQVFQTAPIVEKLRDLESYMPNQEPTIYEFGRYLAERLDTNSQIVPIGFNTCANLALYDLEKGVNGFTGEPISSKLVGFPPQIFVLLSRMIPKIAEAIGSPEFAEGVRSFAETIEDKVQSG